MPARPAPRQRLLALVRHLHAWLTRPEGLAFVPALTLAAFWLGGEGALIAAALGLPALLALAGWPGRSAPDRADPAAAPDPATGLPRRAALEAALDRQIGRGRGGSPACVVLALVEGDALARNLGHAAFTALITHTARNLAAVLRPQDTVARLDGACFAIALAPFPRPDIESLVQVAARLQAAAEVEFRHAGARLTPQTCVGAAQAPLPAPRQPDAPDSAPDQRGARGIPRPRLAEPPDPDAAWAPDTGRKLLDAAEIAMDNARAAGPGTIRIHSARMLRDRADQMALRNDLVAAVQNNELIAHFQPQVCARTGTVTGFEALVRWRHPRRGLLAPAAFLDALIASGLSAQLGDMMLGQALAALRHWDMAGLAVPAVAVNLSAAELRQPALADRIAWELDRHAIAPDRLVIEVLETVIASPDDSALLTGVDRLRDLGCRIDLDDFGTGHAGFGTIRRLGAHRLKIDRSFVTGAHADPGRADMIAAIVGMARQLGLQTVAEGVEDDADRALVARLGCDHAQGYGIARPMPLEATQDWLTRNTGQTGPVPDSDTA